MSGSIFETRDAPNGTPIPVQHATADVSRAVREVAKQWGDGKMQGEALAQWINMYTSLLKGATSAEEIARAADLADCAFLVMQRRIHTR